MPLIVIHDHDEVPTAAPRVENWTGNSPYFSKTSASGGTVSVVNTLGSGILENPALLPWVGLSTALIASTGAANVYGEDGTALWLTRMVPGVERADVRGRQVAWLLVVGPATVVLTVALIALGGQGWAWPWALALLPVVLGATPGLMVWMSVASPVPEKDAHLRAGPFDTGDDPNAAGALIGQQYLMLLLAALTAVPGGALVLLGTVRDQPLLQVAGVLVGTATGVLLAWWGGRDWTDPGTPLHQEEIRTSYSRFGVLENCALQYLYDVEMGLDPDRSHAMWLGTVVHDIVDRVQRGDLERSEGAMLAALEDAWREAGRDPETARFSLMTTCVVGRDRAELNERARRVMAITGRDAEEVVEARPHWVFGTADQVAERLRELEEVGVSRVMLQHLDHADTEMVAVLGEVAATMGAAP